MTTLALRRPTVLAIDPWWVADVGFSKMRVTSPFALRGGSFHGGLDIGNARLGDVLIAVADARVLAIGYLRAPWSSAKPSDAWWYGLPAGPQAGQRGGLYGPPSRWVGTNFGGRMTVLELAPGVAAIYAHQATVEVVVGQRVSAGERIGTIGDSGSAYRQAHVHFGLQAPAAAVPTGVNTHDTTLGYGLDVDPWPLITGQAVLTLEDDDVKIPAGTKHIAQGIVGAGNNLRSAPSLTAPAFYLDPAKYSRQFVQIYGDCDGQEWQGSTLWTWIGWGGETAFVHSKLVTDRQLTDYGRSMLPQPDVDCTDEVAEATTAANGRTEALRLDAIEHLEGIRTTTSGAITRAIEDLKAP